MSWKSLETKEFALNAKTDPHGWIQWKGTDVCMDVHCKCGHHSHIDGDFIYFLECPKCGTVYELNGHIQLIERNREEIDFPIHKAEN